MKTYREILRHLEHQIVQGELVPGTRLPAERKLAQELRVNRSTVSAAYAELRARGLVSAVRGSGTRVSEDVWGAPRHTPDWHTYAAQGVFHPTLPLVRQIWDAARRPQMINLARGELHADMWPTAALERALAQAPLEISLGYGDPRGEPALREAVAVHLATHQKIRVSTEQILITSGAQQALHLLTQCLLRPGDAVALEKPSYAYSLPLFASAGLRTFPLPLDQDGILPEALYDLYRKHHIKLVFVSPTLQNPTGTTLTAARRKRLLEICGELRLPIVEDDAHGALCFTDEDAPPPLIASSEQRHQVIYVGTLSKSMAPGLRVGWIVAPHVMIKRLTGAREQMDQSMSAIGQHVAHIALTRGLWEENLRQVRAALLRRRDHMASALKAYFDDRLAFTLPTGGYHVWGRWNVDVDDRKLLDVAIESGVVITPGRAYGADPGSVRLTFASSREEEIEDGILRLRAAFNSMKGS
ncbi:PLP-dependent aminotransferase family protein [Ferroacidibacillus organovorans]|uniref:HTH gntR-type domain-containing protein n=3 Tax=Ferroacidibacillus organovorans TaxID=1765683 RepID=A0A1V4EX52_9BACL|nr:PLP-dependent aminotransferase family protein [Ferroacidibacillus organovorans]OPG17422.1 hypothetical protein B2M26_01420 [Ferroacidibacillus organovorans]